MKKLFKIALAALMLVSVTACSSTTTSDDETSNETETSSKLVVYSPNSEGLMNAVIPLFEKTYDVDVEVIQAGTGELMKRIESEKEDPYADVMYGGSHAQFQTSKDLFQDYVSVNDANLPEAYQNDSGFVTAYVLDGSVLIVNTDLIGDIKIESYEDLLNPELKGKISFGDPATSSSAFAQLTNILLAKGGYESEEAWDFVGKLITQLDGKVSGSSSGVYKSVTDGEMIVGLSYEDPCAQLVRDGASVKLVYPSEGAVFLPGSAGIVAGAKNLDNAKLFIDFIISDEVQNILGTTLTNRPTLATVETADYMTPISEINVLTEDMDYVNANKNEIAARYTDLFAELQ